MFGTSTHEREPTRRTVKRKLILLKKRRTQNAPSLAQQRRSSKTGRSSLSSSYALRFPMRMRKAIGLEWKRENVRENLFECQFSKLLYNYILLVMILKNLDLK